MERTLDCVLLQLIVVSPLRRTLETAAGVFGTGSWQPGTGPPFMVAQAKQAAMMSAHTAVAAPRVPVVAFEGCRERLGEAGTAAWKAPLWLQQLSCCRQELCPLEPGPAEHLLTGCSCAAAPADPTAGAKLCLNVQYAQRRSA